MLLFISSLRKYSDTLWTSLEEYLEKEKDTLLLSILLYKKVDILYDDLIDIE